MTIRGLILRTSLNTRRQMHVISRATTNIKPASPTPLHLKHYNFPVHDRIISDFYVPFVFFYPNPQPSNKTTLSYQLKNSLSKTLSDYYPFAGILGSEGSYVECNDEGVQFVETQIACKLSEVMERAPAREEKDGYGLLFPPRSIWSKALSSLLFVQLNHFSCGGIALAVSLSHRVGDAATLLSFITYWASLARDSCTEDKLVHLRPRFVQELLPQSYDDTIVPSQLVSPEKHWITREITFRNSKIAELRAELEFKDKLHGVSEQKYTRNELVTAILYRCAAAAAAKSNSGAYSQTILLQAVNTRPMRDPPLPKTSVGNHFTVNPIITNTMNETELNPLICRMRKGRMDLRGKEIFQGTAGKYWQTGCKVYLISSLCNYPLYDGMDFGWGRPAKAEIVDGPFVNTIAVMDTPSRDGIKATICLEEEDMKNFLADKELLAYASVL